MVVLIEMLNVLDCIEHLCCGYVIGMFCMCIGMYVWYDYGMH